MKVPLNSLLSMRYNSLLMLLNNKTPQVIGLRVVC